ncbi:MAG: FAD-binding oxidoreductase [Myxococcota bacterium]
MGSIAYRGVTLPCLPNETVLERLERAQHEIPFSCRRGTCQACTMQADAGSVPPEAQRGLSATQRERGLFLACVCRPTEHLSVSDPASAHARAILVGRRWVAPDVVLLQFETAAPLGVRAGQFVQVVRPDGLARPYSVANPPTDGSIELHIRVLPDGKMSHWLASVVELGDTLELRGPFGDCFYTADAPDRPLLLAGISTGLAPLLGVTRDALARGHRGPITLYHGAADPRGLYLRPELQAMASQHDNLEVRWCTLESEPESDPDLVVGSLPELVSRENPEPRDVRAYLCGNSGFVSQMRRSLFLAGTSAKEIFSDSFGP